MNTELVNPPVSTVTGIVLAGGASSRMGEDKAFVRIGDTTLIERCLDVLRQCFVVNVIVANRPAAFARFGVPVWTDDVPGCGPLGGLQTALHRAETEAVFVVSCDLPFLDAVLIRELVASAGDFDAVVPCKDSRFEPLHALYRRRILPAVERQMAAGDLSLQTLIKRLRVKEQPAESAAWRAALCNVNTPEQLALARRQLGVAS